MSDEQVERLQSELRGLESGLTEPSLAETLRLLGSPGFRDLTDAHVRDVSEYRSIEIRGERFFERAWSRSKEAAAMLGFARLLGAAFVQRDLLRLRGTLGQPDLDAGVAANA